MKAFALAACFLLVASAAHAFPHITVTSSAVVQASPMIVRTTFDVDLVGPGSWCYFEMVEEGWWHPATGDTTKVLGGTPASGWTVSPAADHRVFFNPDGGFGTCFGAGAHYTGFEIFTNNVSPCLHVIFGTPLLGLDGSYHIDACLVADGPVPVQPTTWGSLKSTYR